MSQEFDDLKEHFLPPDGRKKAPSRMSLSGFFGRNRQSTYQVEEKGQVKDKGQVKRWGLKILQGKPKSIVEDQGQVKEDKGQVQVKRWVLKMLQGKPKTITECGRIIEGIVKNINEYNAKKEKSILTDIQDNYKSIITNLKTKRDEYTKYCDTIANVKTEGQGTYKLTVFEKLEERLTILKKIEKLYGLREEIKSKKDEIPIHQEYETKNKKTYLVDFVLKRIEESIRTLKPLDNLETFIEPITDAELKKLKECLDDKVDMPLNILTVDELKVLKKDSVITPDIFSEELERRRGALTVDELKDLKRESLTSRKLFEELAGRDIFSKKLKAKKGRVIALLNGFTVKKLEELLNNGDLTDEELLELLIHKVLTVKELEGLLLERLTIIDLLEKLLKLSSTIIEIRGLLFDELSIYIDDPESNDPELKVELKEALRTLLIKGKLNLLQLLGLELLTNGILTVEDLNGILTVKDLIELKGILVRNNAFDNELNKLKDLDKLKYLNGITNRPFFNRDEWEQSNYLYDMLKAVEPDVRGGRKASVKKEICGKLRCIYTIAGSRKEHVKYKGRLITVADYKRIHKIRKV